ncbi:MAG: DUF1585 domain-containing protein, partial [Pseudomonadota bacterium]
IKMMEKRFLIKATLNSFLIYTMCFFQTALATISATTIFCEKYPESVSCKNKRVGCDFCHTATPQLNAYGFSLFQALQSLTPIYTSEQFDGRLPEGAKLIEQVDSDGDQETNLVEINQGTFPGDGESNGFLKEPDLVWNPKLAFKRIHVLFCGQSASYEDNKTFNTSIDKKAAVHSALTECLQSDFWRNEALHRLADKKIRPLNTVGIDGDIVLADYAWDYRLFSHILTDDRDARDLLLADYHINEDRDVVEGTISRQRAFSLQDPISIGTGQPLEPERRAGMITTQWFLVMNTMFADLPRNTAAQAYRAYLGLDIAKGEGLIPIAGEPRDVDNKNIDVPACAVCHSTLDPLAYAFSTYNGIEIEFSLIFGNPLGEYDDERQPWEAEGFLFGEPVINLMDWAQKAANSDEFKKNLVSLFYNYAIGRAPSGSELETFNTLWRALPQEGYSANQLIHRIVDTTAFGGE